MASRKPERDYKDRIAKRLCYILRYGAITEGLTVHEGGMSPRGVCGRRGLLSFFSSYVGLDPTSTVCRQNISGILTAQKLSPFCKLTLRKDPKCIEMTPKVSPVLWWPPENIHKIFIPTKIFIFLKNPKTSKFQILIPQKWSEPTYCIVYVRVTPWGMSPCWIYHFGVKIKSTYFVSGPLSFMSHSIHKVPIQVWPIILHFNP